MTEFVVVLHFDPATEAKLRDLQETLWLHGMQPESGISYSRPHITLASLKRIKLVELTEKLQVFAEDEARLNVSLDAVGTFPGNMGAVFIAPVVTSELLALHQRFLDCLSGIDVIFGDYYRQGRWMPHCSIALNLPEAKIPIALDLCRRSDVFGPARLVELLLIEYPVVVEVEKYALGSQNALFKGNRE